jgi:hypothetical protein
MDEGPRAMRLAKFVLIVVLGPSVVLFIAAFILVIVFPETR